MRTGLGFATSPTTPTDSRRRHASIERVGAKVRAGLTLLVQTQIKPVRHDESWSLFLVCISCQEGKHAVQIGFSSCGDSCGYLQRFAGVDAPFPCAEVEKAREGVPPIMNVRYILLVLLQLTCGSR